MASMRLISRASPLAIRQAQMVAELLNAQNITARLATRTTQADEHKDMPLHEIGGKGLFTKALDDALLCHQSDAAIHSLKDVPYQLPQGLGLIACLKRHDARDVLIGKNELRHIHELPKNAIIGTSSPRRAAFMKKLRPDCIIKPMRGNIETRLAKLKNGSQYDAIILAAAALDRLKLTPHVMPHAMQLAPEMMLPAAAQGIIAIIARTQDEKNLNLLAKLNHHETFLIATAERHVLACLKADCHTPIAVHGFFHDEMLHLTAHYFAPTQEKHAAAACPVTSEQEARHLAETIARKL